LRLADAADKPLHRTQGAFGCSVLAVLALGLAANATRAQTALPRENEWITTVSPGLTGGNSIVPQRAVRELTAADTKAAKTASDAGRAALQKHDFAKAVEKFSQVLKYPETAFSRDAEEYLGFALQRSGRWEEARAVFEDYIARYRDPEGAQRVHQRLDGLITAKMPEPPSSLERADDAPHGPKPATWTISGSVAERYIRDDSYRTVRDPTVAPNPNEVPDAHIVHINEIQSTLDFIATLDTSAVKSTFRVAYQQDDFLNGADEAIAVATLLLDMKLKELNTEVIIGRQVRNADGVLGRIDGVVVSWQAEPNLRINAVAGEPVARRRDKPLVDERVLYGLSVDYDILPGLQATLFYIEQRDRMILDRRAIGAEMHYFANDKTLSATLDYDVHFNDLNAAIINGTWNFDKSNIRAGFDYRKTPYLMTWNGVRGQPYASLYDMLKAKTLEETSQLAVDRSASWTSASAGFTYALSNKWVFDFDATWANISGTIASGGVDAALPSGQQYYYAGQFVGSNVLAEGDLYVIGARLADLPDSTAYVLDLTARYPWFNDLDLTPRLQVGYLSGSGGLTERFVQPSVLANYHITKDLTLELEAGVKFMERSQAGLNSDETEIFGMIGLRYDFHKEGQIDEARLPYWLKH
jgi:hypothetical protein